MFQKLSAQTALKASTVAVAVVMLTAGASLAQDRQPDQNQDQNRSCSNSHFERKKRKCFLFNKEN